MARTYSNHTKVLFVMVTPEEKEAIKACAYYKRISQNELVRRACLDYMEHTAKTAHWLNIDINKITRKPIATRVTKPPPKPTDPTDAT